ncbi:MAG: IclR family transcriptional regulator [Actinomycetota bacterium]|nr:IclR family transcriptional regulator [Actinomycetota bacterium]
MKSAERLLAILRLLATYARPVPTMTIARECGIPKSSVHHLLNVMRAGHFVTYYEVERAWGLGVSVFEIGSAYLRSAPLQRMGRHLLTELTQRTGETSHLAMLHGTEVLYIDKEQPVGSPTKLVTEVGVRLPAHLTAVGRAILAECTEAQVRAIYANNVLVLRTGRGPTSIDGLLRDLVEVRARGIAYDVEMVTLGISCLAAPVFSHEDVAIAAMGITYVSAQRSDSSVQLAVDVVREVSGRLSANLGHVPRSDPIAELA